MGKESTTPRWARDWQSRQTGPWRRRPLPRTVPEDRHPDGRRPFTLVELLVTIAVLVLLLGLTVKGVAKFRRAAPEAERAGHVQSR